MQALQSTTHAVQYKIEQRSIKAYWQHVIDAKAISSDKAAGSGLRPHHVTWTWHLDEVV
jgi:hypothetical protein